MTDLGVDITDLDPEDLVDATDADPGEPADTDELREEVAPDTADHDVLDAAETEEEVVLWDCPNSRIEPLEECDDGSTYPNDGCSPDCMFEEGYSCRGEPSDCQLLSLPPAVFGERSAGHRRPIWTWEVPTGATQFRLKVDGSDWVEVPLEQLSYRPDADLSDGEHHFEIQAANIHGAWSSFSTRFVTTIEFWPRDGYWDGLARRPATTTLGNLAALACSDCYVVAETSAVSLAATKVRMLAALSGGLDAVQIDVVDVDGVLFLDSEDGADTSGALLDEVLASSGLSSGDVVLVLSLAESTIDAAFAQRLLAALNARREPMVRNGRPAIVQAIYADRAGLQLIMELLESGDYPFLIEYVRFQVAFLANEWEDIAAFQAAIAELAAAGIDSVSFHFQDDNLFAKLRYAQSLGLGAAVAGVPSDFGSLFVANIRDDVDMIFLEGPFNGVRQTVEADDRMLYLNVWEQPADQSDIFYFGLDAEPREVGVGGTAQPTLSSYAAGSELFGTTLSLDRAAGQELTLLDVDTADDAGLLVSAVVRFADLDTVGLRETRVLVGKAEDSGWTLEIHWDLLRFGVHVGGEYRYASYPLGKLNEEDAYFLTGAYGGQGKVRLWVDNADGFVLTASTFGEVSNNDVPIVVGADPAESGDREFFFSGEIQQLQVMHWSTSLE